MERKYHKKPASVGSKTTAGILEGLIRSMEAMSKRLGLDANVHPASSALLPAITIGNQVDPGENLPDDPQWHPVRPRETYMEQQKELLQEMDLLVTQFEKDHNSPASQKWLLAKMRGFLMASKNITEERISAIKALAEPAKDKAGQNDKIMQMDINRIVEPRCSNHGHHGARSKDKVRKSELMQSHQNQNVLLPGANEDLSHPHHPYFNVWKKWNPAHKTMSQTPENAVPEQSTMMDEEDDEGLDNDRWKTTNATLNNTLALCHDHDIGFDDKSDAGKCV